MIKKPLISMNSQNWLCSPISISATTWLRFCNEAIDLVVFKIQKALINCGEFFRI